MKNARMLRWIFLGLLAVLTATPNAGARTLGGAFDLPVAVQWGPASLPAGHYTFVLSTDSAPYLITVHSARYSAVIMASGGYTYRNVDHSGLEITSRGAQSAVKSLAISEVGMVFYYRTPRNATPLMTRSKTNPRQVAMAIKAH
jgi:hypothetical protein